MCSFAEDGDFTAGVGDSLFTDLSGVLKVLLSVVLVGVLSSVSVSIAEAVNQEGIIFLFIKSSNLFFLLGSAADACVLQFSSSFLIFSVSSSCPSSPTLTLYTDSSVITPNGVYTLTYRH